MCGRWIGRSGADSGPVMTAQPRQGPISAEGVAQSRLGALLRFHGIEWSGPDGRPLPSAVLARRILDAAGLEVWNAIADRYGIPRERPDSA